MDCTQFRAIMRQHVGGVVLICTGAVGHRKGLTATAVCSVTDDPPTLLVCVNKSASAHDAIATTGRFSVNLLGDQHEHIACIFSGQSDLNGEERFKAEGCVWSLHASGTPRLEGALAHMDCSVEEQQQFSSHTIFIGRINEGGINGNVSPLLYCRGKFGRWTELESA